MSAALHQVLDRQHGGVVAAVLEHPAAWRAESFVAWDYRNVSWPVVCGARALDPQGADGVEILPGESFCWLEPNFGFYPPGTPVLGQTSMPPQPAADVLARWVVPKFRGNRPGLALLGAGPARGDDPSAETAAVRLRYEENGRAVEEEISGTKVLKSIPYHCPQGTTIQINWGFLRFAAIRSAPGGIEAVRETALRVIRSVRLNPLWERLCADVGRRLQAQFDQFIAAGYSQIQAAGQLSRAISANNDAMLAGFEAQRRAAAQSVRPADRSPTDGFSEYVRGVETVNDPQYGTSQQDASYSYHWTDGQGTWKHSNDPFFNPNIGGSVSWNLMERART